MAFNGDSEVKDSIHHERQGSSSPVAEMEAPLGNLGPPQTAPSTGISQKAVDDVMYSDIGINVLLNRLKQSIASARDFASFLNRRSAIEEAHAKELRKVSKATYDAVRRPEGRQGTYALQVADVTRAQERMADNGMQFANSLHQMHDDLNELSNNMERSRKHWKQEGLNSEKKVKDAESLLEKAKARYDQLAESYDRARTGESTAGRVFTVKGPKSAEKHEEDLLRKLQTADSDYASRVLAAQAARQENVTSARPQAVRAIQELIKECDAGLTLQLQKFANFNEKLLVNNGVVISPVKDPNGAVQGTPSMREMVQHIDNDRDFHTFVTSHTSSLPPKPTEIKYEKHPALGPTQQAPVVSQQPPQIQTSSQPNQSLTVNNKGTGQSSTSQSSGVSGAPVGPDGMVSIPTAHGPGSGFGQGPPPGPGPYGYNQSPVQTGSEQTFRGPSQQYNQPPPPRQNGPYPSSSPTQAFPSTFNTSPAPSGPSPSGPNGGYANTPPPRNMPPPTKPIFGVPLEVLFQRDESAVPLVVYQCIQAVDLFGLEVEGIYRIPGNQNHINHLKAIFDNDSSRVDFRNPEAFYHDVNSVAGLLKRYFAELPEPLLTREHYQEFIDAARNPDDNIRRDSIHAIINALPDPNYATLRALVLHLHRIQEHAQANRMSTANLAICFAPTIMGQHTGPHMADAGLQATVVDTVLQNTYQIFDED